MKKSRFTESQIMAILKQHEAGVSIPELAREHPSSTLTLKSKPFPANKSAYNAAYRGVNSKPSVVARLNQSSHH